MARCKQCKGEHFGFLDIRGGLCDDCRDGLANGRISPAPDSDLADHSHIILSTEAAPDLRVEKRLDILTAECVIGLHLFKDMAVMFRDTFGGRSKVMQDGLRNAKATVLSELRREASLLGADAVLGVALDYSEISGGGRNMILLVASGTAVKLSPVIPNR